MGYADSVYRKKRIVSTPDRTRHQATPWSSLPLSSSLHGVPWRTFIPAASQAACRLTFAASSNQPSFGGGSDQSQYVRRDESLVPLSENDIPSYPSPTKKHPSLRYYPTPERKPPHKATRASLPKTGRLVDDLYNRQDRTPEFALILFE